MDFIASLLALMIICLVIVTPSVVVGIVLYNKFTSEKSEKE